jgi:outer membrane lipoprotein-sorting protein
LDQKIMASLLRRLSLGRLLLLCGSVVALGAAAAAAALAVGSGPTPPPEPLAQAVHDALAAPPVQGVSARIELTDHLLEGADLASGSSEASEQLGSNPLLSGAAGRLWVSADGRVRLELQAEKGDTQILYDGRTVSLYDAASNTLYHYTLPAREHEPGSASESQPQKQTPSLARIEEGIAHLSEHFNVSAATPTDIAGQAAYTARVGPKEGGSLFGAAELSWDAVHGVPLRAAIYSTSSAAPVIELAATEISYGPVESSVFEITPPPNAKVEEVKLPHGEGSHGEGEGGGSSHHGHPTVHTYGHGPAAVAVIEAHGDSGGSEESPKLPEGLQKVQINGASATVLPTALGTLLTFERAGVRYLLVGSVPAASIEEVAKGL